MVLYHVHVLTPGFSFFPIDMHVHGQITICEHISHTVCNVCEALVKLVGFPNHYGKPMSAEHPGSSLSLEPLQQSDSHFVTIRTVPMLLYEFFTESKPQQVKDLLIDNNRCLNRMGSGGGIQKYGSNN